MKKPYRLVTFLEWLPRMHELQGRLRMSQGKNNQWFVVSQDLRYANKMSNMNAQIKGEKLRIT